MYMYVANDIHHGSCRGGEGIYSNPGLPHRKEDLLHYKGFWSLDRGACVIFWALRVLGEVALGEVAIRTAKELKIKGHRTTKSHKP